MALDFALKFRFFRTFDAIDDYAKYQKYRFKTEALHFYLEFILIIFKFIQTYRLAIDYMRCPKEIVKSIGGWRGL